MNRYWLWIVTILSLITISCNQNKKTEKIKAQDSIETISPVVINEKDQLSEIITQFVEAFVIRDNQKINRLIHPELGIYIIYRPGASDTFVKVDSLDFDKPVPEVYAYPKMVVDYSLTYDKLPVYNCGTEKWDKLGFICDTTAHPNQLSNIAAFEDEFDVDKFSEDDLLQIEKAEKESFRIIVTAETPLIFHVRKYKGIWYVTTLDRAYGGCDA